MTFLVDSNILSEGMKPHPDVEVLTWLQVHEEDVVVGPIILGELRFGILRMPHEKKRDALEVWFEEGVRKIVCLPWDTTIALRWAELLAKLHRSGRQMPLKDSMIAATALVHELTLVTRNQRDFKNAGLAVINPFE